MFGLRALGRMRTARKAKKASNAIYNVHSASTFSRAGKKIKKVKKSKRAISKRQARGLRKSLNKNQVGAARKGKAGTTHRYRGTEGIAQRAMERASITTAAAKRNATLGIAGTAVAGTAGVGGGYALGKKKKKR